MRLSTGMVGGMTLNQASTAPRPSDTDLVAASLMTLADGMRFGTMPVPTTINMWRHNVTKRELIKWAGQFGRPIELREPENASHHAIITVTMENDVLPAGTRLEMHISCWDMSALARADYADFNKELKATLVTLASPEASR